MTIISTVLILIILSLIFNCTSPLDILRSPIRDMGEKNWWGKKNNNNVLLRDLAKKCFILGQCISGSGKLKNKTNKFKNGMCTPVGEFYFEIGLKYKDIKSVLGSRDGFLISKRHLKRLLNAKCNITLTSQSWLNSLAINCNTLDSFTGTIGCKSNVTVWLLDWYNVTLEQGSDEHWH